MILCTHAIIGGAIASLLPLNPAAAAIAGFASHFAIDAIPHWDYPLRSISLGKDADNRRLSLSSATLTDFAIIGCLRRIWPCALVVCDGKIDLGDRNRRLRRDVTRCAPIRSHPLPAWPTSRSPTLSLVDTL